MNRNLRPVRLPDLGEGLIRGEIRDILVAIGDTVTADQPAFVVETAKASVELPLPFGGEVTDIHVAIGEMVPVGAALITLSTDEVAPCAEGTGAVSHLVGQHQGGSGMPSLARRLPSRTGAGGVVLSPALRRLARSLNVDPAALAGTGPDGAITALDVQQAAAARRPVE